MERRRAVPAARADVRGHAPGGSTGCPPTGPVPPRLLCASGPAGRTGRSASVPVPTNGSVPDPAKAASPLVPAASLLPDEAGRPIPRDTFALDAVATWLFGRCETRPRTASGPVPPVAEWSRPF